MTMKNLSKTSNDSRKIYTVEDFGRELNLALKKSGLSPATRMTDSSPSKNSKNSEQEWEISLRPFAKLSKEQKNQK